LPGCRLDKAEESAFDEEGPQPEAKPRHLDGSQAIDGRCRAEEWVRKKRKVVRDKRVARMLKRGLRGPFCGVGPKVGV